MSGVTPQRRKSGTTVESEQRSLEHLGPDLTELPWSDPAGARRSLSSRREARFLQAVRKLDECWLEDPRQGALDALHEVARGLAILHGGARSRLPPWILHDYYGRLSTSIPAAFHDPRVDLGAIRQYALEGADPFAHRPVNLRTLAVRAPRVDVLCEVLALAGLHQQLRVVFYEEGRLTGHIGFYLPERESVFTVEDHAALHALVPALRRWLNTVRALGCRPLQDNGLTTAIDANDRPSYLVRDDGVVVFANAAARKLSLGSEELRVELARHKARSIRLPLGTEVARLIMLDAGLPANAAQDDLAAKVAALPVSLRCVAEALARGLSDKEVALELELPLSTVRTYTRRIFSRLGISSRRELIKLGTTGA